MIAAISQSRDGRVRAVRGRAVNPTIGSNWRSQEGTLATLWLSTAPVVSAPPHQGGRPWLDLTRPPGCFFFNPQNRNSTCGLAFAFESLATVDHNGRRNSSTSERNADAHIRRRHAGRWSPFYRISRRALPAGSTDNFGFFAAVELLLSRSLPIRQYLSRSKRSSRLRAWFGWLVWRIHSSLRTP